MTVTFLLFLKEILGSLIGLSDLKPNYLSRLCNQIFTIMIGIVYKRPLQSFYFFSFQVYYD